jgi:hypothetical protein
LIFLLIFQSLKDTLKAFSLFYLHYLQIILNIEVSNTFPLEMSTCEVFFGFYYSTSSLQQLKKLDCGSSAKNI